MKLFKVFFIHFVTLGIRAAFGRVSPCARDINKIGLHTTGWMSTVYHLFINVSISRTYSDELVGPLVTLSDFHCVSVSGSSPSIRRLRDMIYFLKAMTKPRPFQVWLRIVPGVHDNLGALNLNIFRIQGNLESSQE